MIFSSYQFIFLFIPVVLAGYFLLNHLKQNLAAKYFLVAASLFFYWKGSPGFFPFFVISIFFNYLCGYLLNRIYGKVSPALRKFVLIIGIMVNLAFLGYYKYMDFFISNINFFTGQEIPLLHIILPIGISFFTFQLIAFQVDAFRGEADGYRLIDYLLFITFFPQLIVGPIVHHKEMVPQFENEGNSKLDFKNIFMGILLFSIGCAKKILIADQLTPLAQAAFDQAQSLDMIEAWLASFSYTISYYFDLSGYADMAIGLGCLFNIKIPINFNSPYKSKDFAEYWRRWHMTLSRFLGDYIFRSIYKKGAGSRRFYFAVFMTFLVSGFWHGAGWTFVVWGIINGLFVMAAHYMNRHEIKIPGIIAWPVTFLGVVLLRVLFVASSFDDAIYVIITMFDISKFSLPTLNMDLLEQLFVLAVASFIVWAMPNTSQMREHFKPEWKWLAFGLCLFGAAFMAMNQPGEFLYFQF